ncbi:cupin domain-containing protein [bacterium]|nr:cupin domain-containing protein [bacterium]
MVVKSSERQKRIFKGVDYLVGATGEHMMVTLMLFKRNQEVDTHSHINEQAGYCIKGKFVLTIDRESSEIGSDDSYVIPGGVSHSYRVLEDALAVEMFSPPRH